VQVQRICDIGLSADASRAFHSMLKVVDGRSSASWQPSDFDHADVLLAHAGSDPAQLVAWVKTGKPVVMVVDERSSRPPSPFVLQYPFRVMQLLSMLDDVVEHMGHSTVRAVDADSVWGAAESLRLLMSHAGARNWHMAQGDGGATIWVGDGQARATPGTITRLRTWRLAVGSFHTTSEAPPANVQPFALCDAAWFVGMNGPHELAPWLLPDAAYRLRRWPDFGRLGATHNVIELSALLAVCAHTPASLAEASELASAEVNRFLTAASLACLLTSAPRAEAPSAALESAAPKSGWMRFVGDLRRRLRAAS
jgi:hypothetical protein